MTQYRWVCPYCFDTHPENGPCDPKDLKEQIDFLRMQIELANMQLLEGKVAREGFVCVGCGQKERGEDGSRA